MSSWSLLVCALAPWVWEKGGQRWGGQLGTRDPQRCCFCCSWEVWAHLVTATAARDCCGSSNQCPIKPHSPTPQLQQPDPVQTNEAAATILPPQGAAGFAHSHNQLFQLRLQHQQLPNSGQAAQPCEEIISAGTADERGAFWRRSVKKTKGTAISTNSRSKTQPRQPQPAQEASALARLPVQRRLRLPVLSTPRSPCARRHSSEWRTAGRTSESGSGHAP